MYFEKIPIKLVSQKQSSCCLEVLSFNCYEGNFISNMHGNGTRTRPIANTELPSHQSHMTLCPFVSLSLCLLALVLFEPRTTP